MSLIFDLNFVHIIFSERVLFDFNIIHKQELSEFLAQSHSPLFNVLPPLNSSWPPKPAVPPPLFSPTMVT